MDPVGFVSAVDYHWLHLRKTSTLLMSACVCVRERVLFFQGKQCCRTFQFRPWPFRAQQHGGDLRPRWRQWRRQNGAAGSLAQAASVQLFAAAEVLADAAVSAGASRPLGLSRLVCMADVSGSMSGTPMHVAIALGILVSEVRIPRSATRCSHFRRTLYGTAWITAPALLTKCGVSRLRTGV
jgi:hypothetical protein